MKKPPSLTLHNRFILCNISSRVGKKLVHNMLWFTESRILSNLESELPYKFDSAKNKSLPVLQNLGIPMWFSTLIYADLAGCIKNASQRGWNAITLPACLRWLPCQTAAIIFLVCLRWLHCQTAKHLACWGWRDESFSKKSMCITSSWIQNIIKFLVTIHLFTSFYTDSSSLKVTHSSISPGKSIHSL